MSNDKNYISAIESIIDLPTKDCQACGGLGGSAIRNADSDNVVYNSVCKTCEGLGILIDES